MSNMKTIYPITNNPNHFIKIYSILHNNKSFEFHKFNHKFNIKYDLSDIKEFLKAFTDEVDIFYINNYTATLYVFYSDNDIRPIELRWNNNTFKETSDFIIKLNKKIDILYKQLK